MNFIFYFSATFFLIILQTIILPNVTWFNYCFDLQLINILYLSLLFSQYRIIFSIILIGVAMDSLSGAPFFYYTFSYFWIWVIIQGMKRFVFLKSIWFLLMISLISVLVEHVFLMVFVFSQQGENVFAGQDFKQMLWQVFSAVIIIPPAIWTMNLLFQNYVFTFKQFIKNFRRI